MSFRRAALVCRQLLFLAESGHGSARSMFLLNGWVSQRRRLCLLPKTVQQPIVFYAFRTLTSQAGISDKDLKKRVEELTDDFMEARELLQDARDGKDTVYFGDDLREAAEAVKKTLEGYHQLRQDLSESQTAHVTRSIGLKMEELKAQLEMISEEIKD